MGAFMVFDIEFERVEDRNKFEEKYKIKKKDILVGEKSNSGGFSAWTFLRNPNLNIIYNMGFMGYADPEVILKECLKGKDLTYDKNYTKEVWKKNKYGIIKIKFLAWIPINDKNSTWKKLKGRWE